MSNEATMKAVGLRIRAAREKVGMTQIALAERVSVRSPTVWRYEAGQLLPSAGALDRLADALGVSMDWLLHGDDASSGSPAPSSAA